MKITVRASTFSSKKLLNDATASALKDVVLASGDFDQIDMLKTYDQSEFSKTTKSIMSAGYKPPSESKKLAGSFSHMILSLIHI